MSNAAGQDASIDINLMQEKTGRTIKEDKTVINLADTTEKMAKGEDGSGFTKSNTVFGDQITASRVSQNTGNFYYGVDSREATQETTGTGSVTITGNVGFENLLTIQSGGTAASTANIESNEPSRYIPGYELGFLSNAIFTKPTGDGSIKIGLLDGADNGIFIGFKEVGGQQKFGFGRIKDQSETFIAQEDFNADTADGNGISGLNLDFTKGNLFRIRFGVGFKPPVLEVLTPEGQFILLHKLKYPNSETETFISTSFLNPRVEISNGTTAENVAVKISSFNAYISDGASLDVNNRDFSLGLIDNIPAPGSPYDRYTIIEFRNSGTFQGSLMPSAKSHKIAAILDYLSIALSGQGKPVELEIIAVPDDDVSGGTYTKVSTDSILDYSQNSTVDYSNGTVLFATTLLKDSDKIEPDLEKLRLKLRPGFHAAFAITSDITDPLELAFANAWSEEF